MYKISLIILLLFLIFFFCGCTIGQHHYNISGRIITEDGIGVSNHVITFTGGFSSVVTNGEGFWEKKGLSGTVIIKPLVSTYSDSWIFEPSSVTVNKETHDITFISKPNREERWRNPRVTRPGYYERFNSLFKSKMQHITMNVDGLDIPIYYGNTSYYLKTSHDYVEAYDLSNQYDIYVRVQNSLDNNLIEVNGQTYTVQYESSNTDVATISPKGVIAFLAAGETEITVIIGSASTSFNISVFSTPTKEGVLEAELIQQIGFPSSRTSITLPWYEPRGFLDDIYYNYGDYETKDITIRHWHYSSYPDIVYHIKTSFGDNYVANIWTKGWDCGYCQ